MADLRPSQLSYIETIENIRVRNNRLWMDILRIAMAADPEMTKSILRDINLNDQKISRELGALAND